MKKMMIFAVAAMMVAAVFAEAEESGRWTFSAGPAWRSRVTIKTTGRLAAPAPIENYTVPGLDMSDPANWEAEGAAVKVDDPLAGVPGSGVPEGGKLWQISTMSSEYRGVAGNGYQLNSSEEDSPMGLTLSAGYELWRGGNVAVELGLRFAGYWNMKSSTRGYFDAGYTQIDYFNDNYTFPSCPVLEGFAEDVNPLYDQPEYADTTPCERKSEYLDRGSRMVTTRFRSDLYQIGFGPKVCWSPFADWLDALSWLDVYGGAEVIGNVAYSKLTADGASASSTDFIFGFGGFGGILGRISERISVYGQIGYEWIDDADLSVGDFKSEIDYSSMVISAGVQFRF